jgi:hypothetical protein
VPRKEALPKGKRQVLVLLSEDLYKQVSQIAVVWYGKNRGALSAYVEYVLRRALEDYLHTQIHTKNPSRSVRAVYEQVVRKIMEIKGYSFKPEEIPEGVLDQAIADVRGSDSRTIAKWKNIFHKSGLIKYIGGFPPNRVVELL